MMLVKPHLNTGALNSLLCKSDEERQLQIKGSKDVQEHKDQD